MSRILTILILLVKFLAFNCQDAEMVQVINEDIDGKHFNGVGKPSYSFSYGVSDTTTGDMKSAWERKEGDTVKGHYSVLEPDGTMRSVEYSAGPKTGFTAVVNNESGQPVQPSAFDISMAEPKAMRDFEKFYDISENMDEDDFYERKRDKRPNNMYKELPNKKRAKYPFDLEPSEYTHSITIKHPRDEYPESDIEAAHSHVGYSFDPNCKTKTKKENHDYRDNVYSSLADFEHSKQKFPSYPQDIYREPYDKYAESSSHFEFEKLRPYSNKYSKFEEHKPSPSMKYNYQALPDLSPPDKFYPDEFNPRPKKKNRPHKLPEFPGEDLDDYILVPKKKYKPTRAVEPNDYRPELEEYDRPSYSGHFDDDERIPHRGNTGNKEVIRKIVKKRRPVVNLLDIFDL